MNKKKILGVILLSILFVLAGCSKKELSKIEMIEGSYNTDKIYFKEDIDKMKKDSLSDFFGYGATKNELEENEAIASILISGNTNGDIYEIGWSDSDKTKKVDSITINLKYKETKKGRVPVYKKYSGVRVQNK